MSDLLKKEDVLAAIREFQSELYGKDQEENEKKKGKFDEESWRKAYKMGDLYDKLYRLSPVAKKETVSKAGRRTTAVQIVKNSSWGGEFHICSKCGRIVPFIDWGEPYCSGCGSQFKNYRDFCKQDSPCEECIHLTCDIRDGKRVYICNNEKTSNHGEIGEKKESCSDVETSEQLEEKIKERRKRR